MELNAIEMPLPAAHYSLLTAVDQEPVKQF